MQSSYGTPAPSSRAAPSPSTPALSEDAIATYLLSKKYYLAALELHQELLEGNAGIHNVAPLNKFFNDAGNYASLVRRVQEAEATNKANGATSPTAATARSG